MTNYVHVSDKLTKTNSVSLANKTKRNHGLYFFILDTKCDLRFSGFFISPLSEIKQGVCLLRDANKICKRVEILFGKLQRIWSAWDQLFRAGHEEEIPGALIQGFHKTQTIGRNREVPQYLHLTE